MEPEQWEFQQKFDRLEHHTQEAPPKHIMWLLVAALLRNLNERLSILEDRQSNEDRAEEDARDW